MYTYIFRLYPRTYVLKEHVCHMATVRHLFKNFNEELSSKKFKDPGLVPLKKRKWGDRDE